MSIDTLLQLFSSSFNIFKKNIKIIAPFIILYSIIINILIQLIIPSQFNIDAFSDLSFIDIIKTLFLPFLSVSYFIILLNYIFTTIKNKVYKTQIIHSIISWFSVIFIVSIISAFIYIILNNLLITIIIFISLYFLIVFVAPIMIDKKYSLIKSIAYSYTLTINNIGTILLFFGSVILVLFFSGILIEFVSNFISIINIELSILITRILTEIVFYFILIWFSLFYLKLSNSE